MFAGPNGSGKSTLAREILSPELRGIYVNPDDIEYGILKEGYFDLQVYRVEHSGDAVVDFIQGSVFIKQAGLGAAASRLRYEAGKLYFPVGTVNSYFASVISDFVRHALLEAGISFTFETVMSSRDKVDFLAKAQGAGCRTYLYFVSTENPIINESRVKNRVATGGHDVPRQKIFDRYYRSLALLPEAIRASNRAYIFDNSGGQGEHAWLAEITDGSSLEVKTDLVPAWFKRAVLDA